MRLHLSLAGLAGIAAVLAASTSPLLAQTVIKYGHYQPGRMDTSASAGIQWLPSSWPSVSSSGLS